MAESDFCAFALLCVVKILICHLALAFVLVVFPFLNLLSYCQFVVARKRFHKRALLYVFVDYGEPLEVIYFDPEMGLHLVHLFSPFEVQIYFELGAFLLGAEMELDERAVYLFYSLHLVCIHHPPC